MSLQLYIWAAVVVLEFPPVDRNHGRDTPWSSLRDFDFAFHSWYSEQIDFIASVPVPVEK
jgi:hypothetical protein